MPALPGAVFGSASSTGCATVSSLESAGRRSINPTGSGRDGTHREEHRPGRDISINTVLPVSRAQPCSQAPKMGKKWGIQYGLSFF